MHWTGETLHSTIVNRTHLCFSFPLVLSTFDLLIQLSLEPCRVDDIAVVEVKDVHEVGDVARGEAESLDLG